MYRHCTIALMALAGVSGSAQEPRPVKVTSAQKPTPVTAGSHSVTAYPTAASAPVMATAVGPGSLTVGFRRDMGFKGTVRKPGRVEIHVDGSARETLTSDPNPDPTAKVKAYAGVLSRPVTGTLALAAGEHTVEVRPSKGEAGFVWFGAVTPESAIAAQPAAAEAAPPGTPPLELPLAPLPVAAAPKKPSPAPAAPAPTPGGEPPALALDLTAETAPAPVRKVEAAAERPVAVEPSPPPAVATTTRPTTPAARPFSVAVFVGLLVPSGLPTNTAAEPEQPIPGGSKALTFAATLAARYVLPFAQRAFSAALELGWYPLEGSGQREFTNDPDYGPTLKFSYAAVNVPIQLGVAYRVPVTLPVALAASMSLVLNHSAFTTTYTRSDGTTLANATQTGWAVGFALGADAGYALGPGEVAAWLRYVNARTDLAFKSIYQDAYNRDLGDVEGVNVLVGYRYAF